MREMIRTATPAPLHLELHSIEPSTFVAKMTDASLVEDMKARQGPRDEENEARES